MPAAEVTSGRASQELAKELEDETGVVPEVATGQATRLGCKTEYPFKPAVLHPLRSPAIAARDEVESSPDGKHYGVNPAEVVDYPMFLPGAAEANKEQACAGSFDSLNSGQVFLGSKRPKGRAFGIGHAKIRVTQSHYANERIEIGLASAIEAGRYSGLFRGRQQGSHGIRAADPPGASLSQRAKRPYKWHTVGKDRAGFIELKKESRIVNGFHQHVDRSEKHCA